MPRMESFSSVKLSRPHMESAGAFPASASAWWRTKKSGVCVILDFYSREHAPGPQSSGADIWARIQCVRARREHLMSACQRLRSKPLAVRYRPERPSLVRARSDASSPLSHRRLLFIFCLQYLRTLSDIAALLPMRESLTENCGIPPPRALLPKGGRLTLPLRCYNTCDLLVIQVRENRRLLFRRLHAYGDL